RDVLPTAEPAHEIRGRHRRNLPAQPAERQPVNASEQPTLAPFGPRPLLVPVMPGEGAPQCPAGRFEPQACLLYAGWLESDERAQLVSGGRTNMAQPSLNQ